MMRYRRRVDHDRRRILDEPKNSGRRVAAALEVEIGLKQSSAHRGVRVDLPLEDRSLGLHYDWFR